MMERPARAKGADAFRTISEAAQEVGVAPHVLRFWETKFPTLRPLKRGGSRRYYRPRDIELLHRIKRLLHEEGYTIKGASKALRSGNDPGSGSAQDLDRGSDRNADQNSDKGTVETVAEAADMGEA
ncbi:MAG: MerR family transcriptional regulator, partial [Alphaproteobacteria bacterium]|nr:MerR family transcriptional regulator [Alphaproteobacteria bacterium]